MRPSRFITALVILAAAVAADAHFDKLVAKAAVQGETNRKRFADFPAAVGAWHATVTPLTQRERELLDVADYLHADFADGAGNGISVYVGYYTNSDRVTRHPPTICYPGSGWIPVYQGDAKLDVAGLGRPLTVNETVFEKGDLRQMVVYWYSMSGYMGADGSWQKIQRLKSILSGRAVAGASKIQIAVNIETTREAAERRLEVFLTEFLPVLEEFIPQQNQEGS